MTQKGKIINILQNLDDGVLGLMRPDIMKTDYIRPSMVDVFAIMMLAAGAKSACLFNAVGAVVFDSDMPVSIGYNGPARGDVNPRDVGCARILDGKIRSGSGKCRGAHAELNAIQNIQISTSGIIRKFVIFVTRHPCEKCAIAIVNKLCIGKVLYLNRYREDTEVTNYMCRLGVRVERYSSDFLDDFIRVNSVDGPLAGSLSFSQN